MFVSLGLLYTFPIAKK